MVIVSPRKEKDVGTFVALVKGKEQTENRSPEPQSSMPEPKYTCVSAVCNGESLVSHSEIQIWGGHF